MQYEEALKAWGEMKLNEVHPGVRFDPESIRVDLEVDPGYTCNCGDDLCYGSYNTPASVEVSIFGKPFSGGPGRQRNIGQYSFEFGEFVRELVTVAHGVVTLD